MHIAFNISTPHLLLQLPQNVYGLDNLKKPSEDLIIYNHNLATVKKNYKAL